MSNTDPKEERSTGNAKWSEADKRLLLITFLGGLGANIGLALIVGLVVEVIRLNSMTGVGSDVLFGVIGALLGTIILGISIFFQHVFFSRELEGWKFWGFYATVVLLLVILAIAIEAAK